MTQPVRTRASWRQGTRARLISPGRMSIFLSLSLLALANLALGAQWTILVYMSADNSMCEQSYQDLAEMAKIGSTPDVNVIVQVDRAGWDSLPCPMRYRIQKGRLEPLGQLPELDMADPENLIEFARFTRRLYPARQYLLVLWDHGNGWFGNPEGLSSSAVLYDASSGNWMGVADGALRQGLDGVRDALGQKLGIVLFDACLMQMIEVAWEADAAAQFLVASEDLVPMSGFPYDLLLDTLTRNPGLGPKDCARLMPDLFVSSYSGGTQGQEEATLSAIDLATLELASSHLRTWLTKIAGRANDRPCQEARARVQTFASEHEPATPEDDNIDLIDYLALVQALGPPVPVPDELIQSLRRAVIACSANSTSLQRAKGLAVWFPDNYLTLKAQHAEYAGLKFAQEIPWLHFLNCFFACDDVKPSPVVLRPLVKPRNTVELAWGRSYDLAPVSYSLLEASGVTDVLTDPIDDPARWHADGFTLQVQSNRSVFSTPGDACASLTLACPVSLPAQGLLSFQVLTRTFEGLDTNGVLVRDVCLVQYSADAAQWTTLDSIYGSVTSWFHCRYLLPSGGTYYVRFLYRAGPNLHYGGIALDSFQIQAFTGPVRLWTHLTDTVLRRHGLPKGHIMYAVQPSDSCRNVGYWSAPTTVELTNYAEGYSLPSPTRISRASEVTILCDFPDGQHPNVSIYRLTGELVKRFPAVTSHQLTWRISDDQDPTIAAAHYFIVVQSSDFRSVGRFTVVR
ncbi:MAG: clostripain-related cysteine peptidase [candidate division WOR-3 bacterium]